MLAGQGFEQVPEIGFALSVEGGLHLPQPLVVHRHSETFQHEADLGTGQSLAGEKQVREQVDLLFRRSFPQAFDTFQQEIRHALEIGFEDGVLARKIIEQVAGRHAGRLGDVPQRGLGVPLLDDAVVQGGENTRPATLATGSVQGLVFRLPAAHRLPVSLQGWRASYGLTGLTACTTPPRR